MTTDLTRRKLPIGIQTFREIREEGYYYVDKTPFALKLATEGKYYLNPCSLSPDGLTPVLPPPGAGASSPLG